LRWLFDLFDPRYFLTCRHFLTFSRKYDRIIARQTFPFLIFVFASLSSAFAAEESGDLDEFVGTIARRCGEKWWIVVIWVASQREEMLRNPGVAFVGIQLGSQYRVDDLRILDDLRWLEHA